MSGAARVVVSIALAATGCIENTAPGNDREAALSSPRPAAGIAAADEAIAGVAADLLHPQTMTDADLAGMPAIADACLFRMTEVGRPVLVYGSRAVIKLNGTLIPLPSTDRNRYAADGVTVTVRGLDGEAEAGEPFAAELVLWLPGKENEVGYHGFSECPRD